MARERNLRRLSGIFAAIGAVALLACCAMPAIACDDVYQGDPAVPEAALADFEYAQTGAPQFLLVSRGPVRRFFAPPQRIVVQQQRPQRIVIQQQRPQRIIVQQAPRPRVIVRPQQQVIVRPQRVIRVPQQQLQLEFAPY